MHARYHKENTVPVRSFQEQIRAVGYLHLHNLGHEPPHVRHHRDLVPVLRCSNVWLGGFSDCGVQSLYFWFILVDQEVAPWAALRIVLEGLRGRGDDDHLQRRSKYAIGS